jgi:hypothetical protein
MDYEIRGRANDEELRWLHEHPLEWLRALKQAKAETQERIARDYLALKSDPRKPDPAATAEDHARWNRIKAEVSERTIARKTFMMKVDDRVAMVRELLPRDQVSMSQLNILVSRLLDLEARLRDNQQTEQVRREMGWLILELAEMAGERS